MGSAEQKRADTRQGGDSGVYALLVGLRRDRRMEIGALGDVHFSKGLYFYVGSALRGIGKRVNRHLRKRKICHWHIDYLLTLGNLSGVVYILTSEKDAECRVARALDQRFESIPEFGCSDCRCGSHLFYQGVERENDGKTSWVGEKEEIR